ncbi:P-type conjugative transfer protein TrbJ [Caulobacter sp. UNC279MFTsu5.1]|uniref:P-type conjugative transfer protein TrbJ n=1 Tax=Caulobacter sp. UNC279MFTsu5.1 TaxID=1502775 RepID=UPI0008F19995|nr:P-type conjugative transfer protein TrbJ [Caulobacter sp. UNC279MFTsu5.1]SFI53287.1 P-type conjugative transfer protein TrbJ [Caulobacter sp. UNC279MFTsu5.1]
MRLRRRRFLAAAMLSLALPAAPALAQFTVFDPTNYASNVLQAARALEQINNQITGLQNQAQMLIGQAKNLASLPYSSLAALQGQIARTRALLGQAQRLAYDVGAIQAAFTQAYGAAGVSATNADLVARADARWANSVAGFEDALKVQAGVIGGLDDTTGQMSSLVTASQGASGALQAAQAGNQLLALQAQQLTGLTALVAAQGRAQALEAADRAAARADAKARFARFMGRQP